MSGRPRLPPSMNCRSLAPRPDSHPDEEQSMKTLIALILLATAASTARADEWKLVWSDEFNESGLPNPARWNYEFGMLRNHERQFYTRARRENARVEDGKLIIEARHERWGDSPSEAAQSAGARRGRGRGTAEF